jgi:hypothetical protein
VAPEASGTPAPVDSDRTIGPRIQDRALRLVMRQLTAGVLVLIAGAMAIRQAGAGGWVIAATIAALAVTAWQLGRCRHRGPLGLLPPTHDDDGHAQPARWFCDACGKTWPAVFEREQRPIARFVGYDESKATAAARRAEELARKQRALAMRRAGIVRVPAARREQPRRHEAEVVQILHKRRFGP